MAAETQQILEELKAIRTDLDYIKEHLIDVDTVLTTAEEARLEESLSDWRNGKTTSREEFEREMDHVPR